MPKVSVIVPAYNVEKYIGEAIDSALAQAQTYQDFEIIVIDDGSTDDTRQILGQYGNKIKYIYQENKGVSAARNRGIREAQGEYIAFLDADDIWLADKLKCQVDIAEQNPEINLIFSDVEFINDKSNVRPFLRPTHGIQYEAGSFRDKIAGSVFNDGSIFKGNLFKDFFIGNMIPTPTVFVRKKCLEEAGCFDESLNKAEDFDLWLRISRKHSLLYFNKVTMQYRKRDDSLTGKISHRGFCIGLYQSKILEKYLCYLPRPDMEQITKAMILKSYKIAIWGYFNIRDLKKVRELCLHSLGYDKFQIKIYLYLLVTFFPAGFIKTPTGLES